jgi:hypothetical protein
MVLQVRKFSHFPEKFCAYLLLEDCDRARTVAKFRYVLSI